MSTSGKRIVGVEGIVLAALLAGLAVSAGWLLLGKSVGAAVEAGPAGHPADAKRIDPTELKHILSGLPSRTPAAAEEKPFFSSELRVVAIGSAYPIPYAAEVCPFTQTPQPTMDQLDRDSDGMTDGWEVKHGLDKYDPKDALLDRDGDGFFELEEFEAGTDPSDRDSHPAYALKLRFLKRHEVPFPLVFQGVSRIADGQDIFQINKTADGTTHFLPPGGALDDIVLQRFVPADDEGGDRLVVARGGVEIVLPRGQIVVDPESYAELINILDRSTETVTMGALLSLCNDVYTVLGVYPDRVVVKHLGSGKVYDIVGLTDEERRMLF